MTLNSTPSIGSSDPGTKTVENERTASKRRDVPIVEDNDLLRSIMKYWMEEEGDTAVVTCQTFSEAEEVTKSMTPDILITDVRLGDFNDIQLGLLPRHSNPEASIVVVTGFCDPVLSREVTQFGAEFLLKPLTRMTLLGAIRRSEPQDQRA